ncbi:MAG: tRNA lysidine(34) synthetase TilS [Candidatus Marinimicrobia bacterium]|nr:tRNA lysidine(34) synthetase TilS [Candidatus Neomarinimicrobiota bacterium]
MKWSSLAEKVHQTLIRKTLLEQNDKILLAVSGGMDSVVMLSVFLELRDYWNWELIVGHIDHGLRPNDDEKEARFCKELAEKHKLQYVEEKIDLKDPLSIQEYSIESTQKPSIESLARDARYRVFSKWMDTFQCNAICTAHHANDQAETVLYRMLTGSGIRGLSGIPLSRDFIKRPLLPFLRFEIESYAKENDLDYFVDGSNYDEKFARNKIRHTVLPALKEMGFPHCENALADSALAMEEATQVMDYYSKRESDKILSVSKKELKLYIEEYLELPFLIQKQIIKNIFKNNLQVSKHISEKHLIQVNNFILSSEIGSTMELLGHELVKDREHIICKLSDHVKVNQKILCKEDKIHIFGTDIELEIKIVDMSESLITDNSFALFSKDILDREFQLRPWKSGDIMRIFGSGYTKKISDILKDEKVNIADKKQQLVLALDKDIIWVPEVKRSDQYVVNKNDEKMVMITYKHGAGK